MHACWHYKLMIGVILIMCSIMFIFMLTWLDLIFLVLWCTWSWLKEYVVIDLYWFLNVHKAFKNDFARFWINVLFSMISMLYVHMIPYLVQVMCKPHFSHFPQHFIFRSLKVHYHFKKRLGSFLQVWVCHSSYGYFL